MSDERATRLCRNLITYSVDRQPGEKLYIELIGRETLELGKVLAAEATRAGGIPFWYYNDEYIQREWLLHSSEDQVREFAGFHLKIMKEVDAYISIRGIENRFQFADIPSTNMDWHNRLYYKPVHLEERVRHTKWCVLRYPNNAMAQMAETSLERFEDFYYEVCTLDYQRMSKEMDPLVKLMQQNDL